MMDIAPVPLAYNGVRYRSSLEADWAAMFTHLGIYFEYEPQQWRMPSGAVYECDFYLPNLRTYCEAKGPHNERLWKPLEFAAALAATEFPQAFQVLILRPAGPGGAARWENAAPDEDVALLALCSGCQHWGFTSSDPRTFEMYCRRCWSTSLSMTYGPDSERPLREVLPMQRAPRMAA